MSNQIAILVCLIMEHLRTVDSECEVIIQWAAEIAKPIIRIFVFVLNL